ncbi:hypothetical protein ACQPUY_17635, partial [Clostridium nigeriense]
MAKEVARIYPKKKDYKEAYREVVEQYKKAHNSTDQSKSYEHNKRINDIIPLGIDLDNGEIYDIETGQTIRELI